MPAKAGVKLPRFVSASRLDPLLAANLVPAAEFPGSNRGQCEEALVQGECFCQFQSYVVGLTMHRICTTPNLVKKK